MTPFHKWLIKQRIYCEHPNCFDLQRATKVVQRDGKELVMCNFHAYQPQQTRKQKPT